MVKALAPLNPVFVFDRCEPVEGVNYILNPSGTGFLAGRMRDIGANGIDDDILFLDGDKVPTGDIVFDINRLRNKYDCICYGVSSENETSELRAFMQVDDTDGIMPFQLENHPCASGCYSCGMWLSKEAIQTLRKFNEGRIFHSDFDGEWGDEDNFLGDELYYSGFRIGYSTHVRLAGTISGLNAKFESFNQEAPKIYGFVKNSVKRILLRRKLFNKD